MRIKEETGLIILGIAAGAINGIFGAGGGMILIPLLTLLTPIEESNIFPVSVSIILPVSAVSLLLTNVETPPETHILLTYLLGSAAGGLLAGLLGRKIPTLWLHRILGGMILWGGIRYLC